MTVPLILAAILSQSSPVTSSQATAPQCDQEKAEQGIQQEMNLCAAEEFQRTDEALNAQWPKTVAVMKLRDENFESTYDERPGYFDTLLAAQRAWLTYRDQHCRSEAYIARGGSLEPLLFSTCMTHLTQLRTKDLEELARTY